MNLPPDFLCWRRRFSGALLIWLLSPAGLAAPLPELVVDAPGAVRSLLDQHLALARALRDSVPPDPGQLEALQLALDEDARGLLATEGYFSPQLRRHHQDNTLTLRVDPGPRTDISAVQLALAGPGADGAEGAQRLALLREHWGLPVGQPFRQDDWDSAKNQALRSVQIDRYPSARWAHAEARIDPASQRAVLSATLDTGPAFTLGEIQVHGLRRYPPQAVTRLATFNPGSPYHQRKLLDYQAALQATPYFTSVRVEAGLDPTQPLLSPVQVFVQEAQAQKISVGAGYGSDSGPRGSLNYQHHNIAGLGLLLANTLQL